MVFPKCIVCFSTGRSIKQTHTEELYRRNVLKIQKFQDSEGQGEIEKLLQVEGN
jgi:hypothetical protein